MSTRARRIRAAAWLAGVSLLAAACGGAPAQPTPTGLVTLMDGRGLYATYCARCHGGDLKGTNQGPPFLDAIYARSHHADAAFFLAVRNGAKPHHWNFGPMPPIEGLSDAQITAIIAAVRAEQDAVGIR